MTPDDVLAMFELSVVSERDDYFVAADFADEHDLESFARLLRAQAQWLAEKQTRQTHALTLLDTWFGNLENIERPATLDFPTGYGINEPDGAGAGVDDENKTGFPNGLAHGYGAPLRSGAGRGWGKPMGDDDANSTYGIGHDDGSGTGGTLLEFYRHLEPTESRKPTLLKHRWFGVEEKLPPDSYVVWSTYFDAGQLQHLQLTRHVANMWFSDTDTILSPQPTHWKFLEKPAKCHRPNRK